jgi:uncharacterized membrane protein YeaQ/YmgE (transglycosylase-associated protein family)
MDGFQASQAMALNDSAQQLLNDVLVWIGFGTVVGLLGKALMPGRDPGGTIATILMGIGGTVLGCAVLSFFHSGQRVVPISPSGILVGTLGTLFILFMYKVMSSIYFVDGEFVSRNQRRRRGSARRARYDSAVYED